MKRIHSLLLAVVFLSFAGVSDASPPMEKFVTEPTMKQAVAVNPQVFTVTPTAYAMDYLAVDVITPTLFTSPKPSPMVQSVSLNAGYGQTVSADRSVWVVTSIMKPQYYTNALLPFKYIESRATEYRC